MRLLPLGSLLISAALVVCATGNARAASSEAVQAGESKVRLLVSGLRDTNSAPVYRGGVEIALNPGWKTYWRYPGDAGIPPRFDWSGSRNVASVEVFYPAPKRITDGAGQTSIGYEERVIFPLRITPNDPANPVVLKLRLDFATCEKLCIPAQADLSLAFTAGATVEPSLEEAEKRVPAKQNPAKPHALAILGAKIERGKDPDGKDDRIVVRVQAHTAGDFDLFAEGPGEDWTLPLPDLIENDSGRATFAIPLQGSRLGSNDAPPRVILTLVAGAEAIEAEIPLD